LISNAVMLPTLLRDNLAAGEILDPAHEPAIFDPAEDLVFVPGLCCEFHEAQAPLETGTGIRPETAPSVNGHPVFTRQNIDLLRHGPPGQPE
jgi:hypothetical protein